MTVATPTITHLFGLPWNPLKLAFFSKIYLSVKQAASTKTYFLFSVLNLKFFEVL
jgi:hypothetical protein